MKNIFILLASCLTWTSLKADNFIVTSKADSGPGTLRQAILDSNATLLPTPNVIAFNLPLTGTLPLLIQVSAALPAITRPVQILGNTQPGSGTYPDHPVIDLTGGAATAAGLLINTTNCTVRRLAIYGFKLQGLVLQGGGHLIAGNHIGLNTNGTAGAGNLQSGMWISGSTGNTIGGIAAQDRNVISSNGYNGIYVSGGQSNKIFGNYIGLARSGTTAKPNQHCGIKVFNSDFNQIGGSHGESNIVSGNLGLLMADETGLLGTGAGIHLMGFPFCSFSTSNLIQGNFIGTDITGSVAIGNSMGIMLGGCQHTQIGGSTVAARNVISGNTADGIGAESYGYPRYNNIQGNFIGTDVTGLNPLGNGGNGILIDPVCTEPSPCGCIFDSMIGGTNSPGEGNLIAYNGSAGVHVDRGEHYSILRNLFHDNGGVAIELVPPTGPNPNDTGDPDSGVNGLQNYPVLTRAIGGASTITIDGTLNSEASRQYRLQFFRNILCDGPFGTNGYGEGRYFIGETFVTTDGSGNATFSVTHPLIFSGDYITATATSPEGNTSEFSACLRLRFPPVLTIVNSGATITISWPASSGSAWILQRSLDVIPPVWSDVAITPILSGGAYVISFPVSSTSYIYRLRAA